MQILVDILSSERLSEYNAKGYIAASLEYSCHNGKTFSLNELKKVSEYVKENNKIFVVNIDRIIEEDELDKLHTYLDQLLTLDIDYFIYSDFAILRYFLKKGLTKKLIYDPKTLITNYYDANIHAKEFNSLVAISNELTLDEIKEVSKAKNCLMEVYGFHQMFYSRRALLSNYAKFKNFSDNLQNEKLVIKEENRDNLYIIYESKHGTFIYTPYIYCLFKELSELPDLKFIRINSNFLEEDKIIQVVNIYNELLLDFTKKDELYAKLQEIDARIDSGFLYKKSILLKEEVR